MDRRKRNLASIQSEKGYLMLSTLFLLLLIGIFTQSVIKLSSNYIIQLNEIATHYQVKTALNLAEQSLHNQLINIPDQLPEEINVSTEIGEVNVQKESENTYKAILTKEDGYEYIEIFEVMPSEDKVEINYFEEENMEASLKIN